MANYKQICFVENTTSWGKEIIATKGTKSREQKANDVVLSLETFVSFVARNVLFNRAKQVPISRDRFPERPDRRCLLSGELEFGILNLFVI